MDTTDRDRDGDVALDTRNADVAIAADHGQEPERRPPDIVDAGGPVAAYAPSTSGQAIDDAHGLSAAVDGLADLTSAPVDTHAARYHQVHTLLQDALSEADRGGTASR